MKTEDKHMKETFDTVKFMRTQRDRISNDIMNLTPEEIVKYFEQNKSEKRIKSST